MSDLPSASTLIDAVRLVQADFDGRPTHKVAGKGGRTFEFFPTSITDNIPPLRPEVSRAICLLSRFHLSHVKTATLGVGEEDRGAMIISDLLLSYNLPRTLARWTPTGAPGEVEVPFANEYIAEGQARIFLNGVRPGDRVLIVDDLISTGGTLIALAQAVRSAGAIIEEIFTIGEKVENGGRKLLRDATGIEVKTMLSTNLTRIGGQCYSKLLNFHFGKMPEELFAEVAKAFPPGYCLRGSGEKKKA
jgi:adenine/guanine phosphoribosyltransferase-like PRPP-binding protein